MKSRYKIIENYRDDENLRNEYHLYISMVFPSISFRDWYSRGFWTDKYIPFSIFEYGKIISNVSVAKMNVILNSSRYKAIQLGAVGTLPEYRNQGLSRHLTNYVINKFKDEVDFFFLYANESVMEFYPKFGFRSVRENLFVAESNITAFDYSVRKLNLGDDKDLLLLQKLIKNRQILSMVFGAEEYGFITMWHILNLYQDNLYYLEKENAIIIKEEKDDTLLVLDVIFNKPFDHQSALSKLIKSNKIERIKYFFPPDQFYYEYDKIINEDTGLFILGDIKTGYKPFRFPITAIT